MPSTSPIYIVLGNKVKKSPKAVYLAIKRDFSEIFPQQTQTRICDEEAEEASVTMY